MEEKKKQNRDKDNDRAWRKANTLLVGVNLLRSTDKDIIDYLEHETAKGKSKQGIFKQALREKISRETYDMMDYVAEYSPDYKD